MTDADPIPIADLASERHSRTVAALTRSLSHGPPLTQDERLCGFELHRDLHLARLTGSDRGDGCSGYATTSALHSGHRTVEGMPRCDLATFPATF